tara:strand:+ start:24398 stop:25837 length:1440 start_codon:yes stop_codon:yes gene_type:complete
MIKKLFSHQKETKASTNIKIALIYYIPKSNTEKYNNWTDGFTKGINIIEQDYAITWINLEDELPTSKKLNNFDFIIAKCCWNSKVDRHLKSLKKLKTPCGIAISCSIVPHKNEHTFYKILWHETFWYKALLPNHKNIKHAFGINSSDFKYEKVKKTIDVLSIGALTSYKRHEKLIDFTGEKKVVIGDTNMEDSETIINNLESHNIKVIGFSNQKELSNLINKAKTIYIPCELNGGGERAILEARLCGATILIEKDNPKLKELLTSPIWDEKHYGNQIKIGIEDYLKIEDNTFSSNRISSSSNTKIDKNSFHNGNFEIRGDEYVQIGAYCSFGKNISIITSNHDTNFIASQGYIYRKIFKKNHPGEILELKNIERTKGPVHIGNDVWIGDDVKIMSGVTIGDGACIGAGTIVTKDIDAYEIHAGVPNRKIKMRFSNDIVLLLLNLKWWDWSEKRIKENEELFSLNFNKEDLEVIKKTIVE